MPRKVNTPNYYPPQYHTMNYQELWGYVGHPREMMQPTKQLSQRS
jgi:hypothetical protein